MAVTVNRDEGAAVTRGTIDPHQDLLGIWSGEHRLRNPRSVPYDGLVGPGSDLDLSKASSSGIEHHQTSVPAEATNAAVQSGNGPTRRDLSDDCRAIEHAVLSDMTRIGRGGDQYPVASRPGLLLPSQVAERIVAFELDGASRQVHNLDHRRDQVAISGARVSFSAR